MNLYSPLFTNMGTIDLGDKTLENCNEYIRNHQLFEWYRGNWCVFTNNRGGKLVVEWEALGKSRRGPRLCLYEFPAINRGIFAEAIITIQLKMGPIVACQIRYKLYTRLTTLQSLFVFMDDLCGCDKSIIKKVIDTIKMLNVVDFKHTSLGFVDGMLNQLHMCLPSGAIIADQIDQHLGAEIPGFPDTFERLEDGPIAEPCYWNLYEVALFQDCAQPRGKMVITTFIPRPVLKKNYAEHAVTIAVIRVMSLSIENYSQKIKIMQNILRSYVRSYVRDKCERYSEVRKAHQYCVETAQRIRDLIRLTERGSCMDFLCGCVISQYGQHKRDAFAALKIERARFSAKYREIIDEFIDSTATPDALCETLELDPISVQLECREMLGH